MKMQTQVQQEALCSETTVHALAPEQQPKMKRREGLVAAAVEAVERELVEINCCSSRIPEISVQHVVYDEASRGEGRRQSAAAAEVHAAVASLVYPTLPTFHPWCCWRAAIFSHSPLRLHALAASAASAAMSAPSSCALLAPATAADSPAAGKSPAAASAPAAVSVRNGVTQESPSGDGSLSGNSRARTIESRGRSSRSRRTSIRNSEACSRRASIKKGSSASTRSSTTTISNSRNERSRNTSSSCSKMRSCSSRSGSRRISSTTRGSHQRSSDKEEAFFSSLTHIISSTIATAAAALPSTLRVSYASLPLALLNTMREIGEERKERAAAEEAVVEGAGRRATTATGARTQAVEVITPAAETAGVGAAAQIFEKRVETLEKATCDAAAEDSAAATAAESGEVLACQPHRCSWRSNCACRRNVFLPTLQQDQQQLQAFEPPQQQQEKQHQEALHEKEEQQQELRQLRSQRKRKQQQDEHRLKHCREQQKQQGSQQKEQETQQRAVQQEHDEKQQREEKEKPLLLLLAGPSGTGKSSVAPLLAQLLTKGRLSLDLLQHQQGKKKHKHTSQLPALLLSQQQQPCFQEKKDIQQQTKEQRLLHVLVQQTQPRFTNISGAEALSCFVNADTSSSSSHSSSGSSSSSSSRESCTGSSSGKADDDSSSGAGDSDSSRIDGVVVVSNQSNAPNSSKRNMAVNSRSHRDGVCFPKSLFESSTGPDALLVSTDALRKLLRCYLSHSSNSSDMVEGCSRSNSVKDSNEKEMLSSTSSGGTISHDASRTRESNSSNTADSSTDRGSSSISNNKGDSNQSESVSSGHRSFSVGSSTSKTKDISSSICHDLLFESTYELRSLARHQQQEAAASSLCCCCSDDAAPCATFSILPSDSHNRPAAVLPSSGWWSTASNSAVAACASATAAALAAYRGSPAADAAASPVAALCGASRGGVAGLAGNVTSRPRRGPAAAAASHTSPGLLTRASAAEKNPATTTPPTCPTRSAAACAFAAAVDPTAAAAEGRPADGMFVSSSPEGSEYLHFWPAGDTCSSSKVMAGSSSSIETSFHKVEGAVDCSSSSSRDGTSAATNSSGKHSCAEEESSTSSSSSRRERMEKEEAFSNSSRSFNQVSLYRRDFLLNVGRDMKDWFPAHCYSCGEPFPCSAVLGVLQQALVLQHVVLEPLLHELMRTTEKQQQKQEQQLGGEQTEKQQHRQGCQQQQGKQQHQENMSATEDVVNGSCCSCSSICCPREREDRQQKVIIVEGVHITPAFMQHYCKRYGSRCLAFVLYVHSKEEHAARLRTRTDAADSSTSEATGSSSSRANSNINSGSNSNCSTKQRLNSQQESTMSSTTYNCSSSTSAARHSEERFVHADAFPAAAEEGDFAGVTAVSCTKRPAAAGIRKKENCLCEKKDSTARQVQISGAEVIKQEGASIARGASEAAVRKQQPLRQHIPEQPRDQLLKREEQQQHTKQQQQHTTQQQQQHTKNQQQYLEKKQQQAMQQCEQRCQQQRRQFQETQKNDRQHEDNKYMRNLRNIRCMQLYMCCATQRLAYEGTQLSSDERKAVVAAACARFASEAAAVHASGGDVVAEVQGEERHAGLAASSRAAAAAVPVECAGNNGVYTLHSRDLRSSLRAIGKVLLLHHPSLFS